MGGALLPTFEPTNYNNGECTAEEDLFLYCCVCDDGVWRTAGSARNPNSHAHAPSHPLQEDSQKWCVSYSDKTEKGPAGTRLGIYFLYLSIKCGLIPRPISCFESQELGVREGNCHYIHVGLAARAPIVYNDSDDMYIFSY